MLFCFCIIVDACRVFCCSLARRPTMFRHEYLLYKNDTSSILISIVFTLSTMVLYHYFWNLFLGSVLTCLRTHNFQNGLIGKGAFHRASTTFNFQLKTTVRLFVTRSSLPILTSSILLKSPHNFDTERQNRARDLVGLVPFCWQEQIESLKRFFVLLEVSDAKLIEWRFWIIVESDFLKQC